MEERDSTIKLERRGFKLYTLSIVLIGVLLLLLTGCASMYSTSEYPVNIDSYPPNMEIVVTDRKGDIAYRGPTPAVVDLDARGGYFKRESYTVTLYDAGKAVGQTEIDGSIDGWYFVNIFGPTIIGMLLIDPITGAMWTLDQEVTVYRDVESSETKSSSQPQIKSTEEVPEHRREGLITLSPDEESVPTSD